MTGYTGEETLETRYLADYAEGRMCPRVSSCHQLPSETQSDSPVEVEVTWVCAHTCV